VNIMRAVGIEPDGFVGLSLGELGCSYMDRCISAEQVMLAAYYCGRAILETELIRGSMATVRKSSTFSHIAQNTCQSLFACLLLIHQDKENGIVFDRAQVVASQILARILTTLTEVSCSFPQSHQATT
jgi:malonyl CoA-acyl carrier protein transacylase